MVLTSRRGFVKGAAASCLALANIRAKGLDSGTAAGLPNPIFAYEFGDISPEQQAGFAREYGFEGTVFDHARQMPERLRALDEAHLQLFFLWLTVDISNGQIKYEPGMEAAIEALKGVERSYGSPFRGIMPGAAPERKSGPSRRSIESPISPLDPTFASRSIHTMAFTWPDSRRCAGRRTSRAKQCGCHVQSLP